MRPVLTSHDRWFVTYGSDTDISLQKESVHPKPFGNSKFLTFVHEYYKECSTILDVNPDFHFVPEHERLPVVQLWIPCEVSMVQGKDVDPYG